MYRALSWRTKVFIARRGKFDKIDSDNATHFKTGKKTIDMAWKDIISDPQAVILLKKKNQMELSHWNFSLDDRVLRKTCWNNKNGLEEDH